MPQPDAHNPTGTFRDEWYGEWNPSDSPDDPHDEPYEAPDGDPPTTGPVPENIDVVTPGPFSRSRGL